ncbi:MAG: hypothetical protein ACLSFT_06110 [Ruminococcus callidus]
MLPAGRWLRLSAAGTWAYKCFWLMAADLGTGLLTAGVFHTPAHQRRQAGQPLLFSGHVPQGRNAGVCRGGTRQTYCWTVTSCSAVTWLRASEALSLTENADAWAFCRQRGKMLQSVSRKAQPDSPSEQE